MGSRVLDVEIILESEVDATTLIHHTSNLERRKRIHDLKLQVLNDVAMSVMSCIESKEHLILARPYHVRTAPNYYIDFDVIDEAGNTLLPVCIKLGIFTYTKNEFSYLLNTSNTISSSFVLNGENYKNRVTLISTISNICDELDKGNLGILNSYRI